MKTALIVLTVERFGMSLVNRQIIVSNCAIFVALIIFLAACTSSKPAFRVFATPDEAGAAFQDAAKSDDQNALLAIFGPDSKQLIYSGDPPEDKATINAFASAYQVMHRWRRMPDGAEILIVGVDNFPFPIPLEKNDAGQWFFDTASGKDEILARRIGRNELAVIDVCWALADAQAEYFS